MPTLNWIGKEAVINHHRQVPYHLLRCDNSLSVGNPDCGNLLVEGDNLLALKALLPYYAGQVKCIYIDPPYNTGNENWVYNDNVNSPEMKKWLGKTVGAEAEDLSRHDKWLCMMYPRLSILKEFLREDGAIFISIDDNEVHNLRLVTNEVFGARNFVCTFIWEKKHTRANDARFISDNHDFILLYAKSIESLQLKRLPRTEQANERYSNPDNDQRGDWISQPLQVKTPSEAYIYEIITPSGRRVSPPKGRSWAFGEQRYRELISENRIYFGPNGSNVPRMKKFLSEVGNLIPVTIWPRKEVGDNQQAKDELKNILSGLNRSFDNPKPTKLLKRIIELITDKESIILDSFAGSGTTGHAILDLNKFNKSNQRFILVEMDHDICRNVAAQRLIRVVQGYEIENGEKILKIEGLGGGFRYCKLDKPLFDETGKINESVKFADLAAHVFFTETGMPIPKRTNGASPFLGSAKGTGYYLLFNGILGDKTPDGGNVLTGKVLASLPKHNGPKVIFGEGCRLGEARLRREQIIFKQLPYEIKVS
ncbi:MAG: site-specific DNA-methyltransferase [Sedimentisphaerales bacterium]|nr:site-specific DNA-methyltransferase [Sedimentisphaerales bacterium]